MSAMVFVMDVEAIVHLGQSVVEAVVVAEIAFVVRVPDAVVAHAANVVLIVIVVDFEGLALVVAE